MSAPAERGRRALVALAATVPPAAFLAAERFVFGDLAGFPLDDSWIHLVFARSLAAGEGLAYGAGLAVPASTAPLWTLLLALAALLPGSPFVWAKLAGLAAHAVAVERSYVLARRLGLGAGRASAAALLVAATGWLAWSAVSGMEVPLFIALATAGLARHVEERLRPSRPALSLLLFGLAALARPEGLLLLPLALADRAFVVVRGAGGARVLARPPWRRLAAGALAAALVVAAVGWVHFRLWGSPLPTTFAAKSGGAPRWVPDLVFLKGVASLLFLAQPVALLLAGGGAIELVRRAGSRRDTGLLLPLWTFGLPVASALLSSGQGVLVGNFGRYFFPVLPGLALLALLALERLPPGWGRLAIGGRPWPLGAAALAALFALPAAAGLVDAGRLHLQARANVDDSDVKLARWVVERLPPEARLAVCDVGALRWLAPNPIFDLAGIVSPEVAREVTRARREEGLDWPPVLARIVERERPDYIVVYPRWFALPERDPARFPVQLRLRIPDNVTMAGDELVVYATPWTRYPPRPEAAADPRSPR